MLLPLYPNKSIRLDFVDKESMILEAIRGRNLDSIDAVVLNDINDVLCVLASSFNGRRLAELELNPETGKMLVFKECAPLEYNFQKGIYRTINTTLFDDKCNHIKVYKESLEEVEEKLGRKLEIIPTVWKQECRVDSKNHMKYLAHHCKGDAVVEYNSATYSGIIVRFK